MAETHHIRCYFTFAKANAIPKIIPSNNVRDTSERNPIRQHRQQPNENIQTKKNRQRERGEEEKIPEEIGNKQIEGKQKKNTHDAQNGNNRCITFVYH